MQQVPKLKSLFILRNSISPSSSSSSSSTYYYCHRNASLHSTPPSLAKWKSKWDSFAGKQQAKKSYIKYTVRQKRSDAKKALKDLIHDTNCSRIPIQDVCPTWDSEQTSSSDADEADDSHASSRKSRLKKPRRSSRPGKGKSRRGRFPGDFDADSETVFEARYGNKFYTWSSRLWEEPNFRSSSAGFEWRNQSKWTKSRRRVWDSASETDDDNERSCIVGSRSDRIILGLPPMGPLKIEDVKSAFRSSALKWHPDKHQGPLQTEAEEKFKKCVDAYKGLCSALSE